jgi:hypothetical protein
MRKKKKKTKEMMETIFKINIFYSIDKNREKWCFNVIVAESIKFTNFY